MAPDCLLVLGAEFFVDWLKHAFITRFNEVSAEVYKDYTISLAYDLATTKQKHVSRHYVLFSILSLTKPSRFTTIFAEKVIDGYTNGKFFSPSAAIFPSSQSNRQSITEPHSASFI